MYELVSKKMAEAVRQGMRRMRVHQRNRAMFIKAYVGQYFEENHGMTGDMPINLIYNAIRAIIPQYVMRNPITDVTSDIVEYDNYAFLLGKALDQNNRRTKKKNTLRYGLVDAMFSMGIFKTGLANSGSFVQYGDKRIDPGMVFTDNVSLDDFVPDPNCRSWDTAAFLGDRIRMPRYTFLENDEFNEELIMKIPKAGISDKANRVENMSKRGLTDNKIIDIEDLIDVIYLYVPSADAILAIPDPNQIVFDDYLSATDYYGPKDGPYTFLTMGQPVPDNPFAIAPVGVWYDLNRMANSMMEKVMSQAERQKSIVIADSSLTDEVEDLRKSEDGDVVFADPKSAQVANFGGQDKGSEDFVGSLRTWFNYMAGNPDQMAGNAQNAKTATQSQILASNAAVGLEDGKDMTYDATGLLSEKEAWYMHRDPLINAPIPHRPDGTTDRVQLYLTPAQRRGEPEDFIFKIRSRSMQVKDPTLVAKQILEFAGSIVPAMAQATMVMQQMGQPFNLQQSLTDVADKMGILDEVHDWFIDPNFQKKMDLMMQMGPQGNMKAGTASPGAMAQNGAPANAKKGGPTSPMQDKKSGEQSTANVAQSAR